jgi:aspartate/methionine/tyrosine aminotransferase
VSLPRFEGRLAAMQPSAIREVHNLAARLKLEHPERSFIALHFGESDLGTPPFIVEAGCEALRSGAVFYEDNAGRRDLRQALAAHYDLEPERFVTTCGATQAICLSMLGLVSPGDDAFVLTPLWPNFTEGARIAGANVHEVPLKFNDNERRFELDAQALVAAIERAARPRIVVMNSPSNPTGWTITADDQARLVEICRSRGLYLIADEIYDRIVYTPDPVPSATRFLADWDRLVVINGFSKAYCMTGWRVGYLITHPALAAELARMQEFVTSHAPSMAQVAAITALREGEAFVAESLARYRKLRGLVLDRLSALPAATVAQPDGTFYCFAKLPGTEDSVRFCTELVRETGVSLAPGKAFGAGGEGWVRMCFAKESELLSEAIDRIERFLSR